MCLYCIEYITGESTQQNAKIPVCMKKLFVQNNKNLLNKHTYVKKNSTHDKYYNNRYMHIQGPISGYPTNRSTQDTH